MPRYMYACDCGAAEERVHSRPSDDYEVIVLCKCGERMHRVPQPFQFYNNPAITLLDNMAKKLENKKRGKKNDIYNYTKI